MKGNTDPRVKTGYRRYILVNKRARERWLARWVNKQPPTLLDALRHLFDHQCWGSNYRECRHISKAEHELIRAWVADVVEWHLFRRRRRGAS